MKITGKKSKNIQDRRGMSPPTAAQSISMSHDPNPTPNSYENMQDAVRAPSRSAFTSGKTLDETVQNALRLSTKRSRMKGPRNGQ